MDNASTVDTVEIVLAIQAASPGPISPRTVTPNIPSGPVGVVGRGEARQRHKVPPAPLSLALGRDGSLVASTAGPSHNSPSTVTLLRDAHLHDLHDPYAERAYILCHLGHQESWALKLSTKLAAAQKELAALVAPNNTTNLAAGGGGGQSLSRLRKKINHFSGLLSKSENQSEMMLLRLNELYMEIQRLEREALARQALFSPIVSLSGLSHGVYHPLPEHLERSSSEDWNSISGRFPSAPRSVTPQSGPFGSPLPTPVTPAFPSPLAAEFFPGGDGGGDDGGKPKFSDPFASSSHSSKLPQGGIAYHEAEREHDDADDDGVGFRPNGGCDSGRRRGTRSSSLNGFMLNCEPRAQDKRMSEPSLRSIWPDSEV